jgi:hypothetical protein
MTAKIDMGWEPSGSPVELDLEELLATRLLVQGNSGSGKSHLLRRLLEGSAGLVQQIVIDPEGDFVSLADAFGHIAIDAAGYTLPEIGRLGARAREHRASVVLSLEGVDVDNQMRSAATFLAALFEAPREQWYPALVVVDEAQLFAPAAAGEVSEEARRTSLAAMTNLMCRGRKRGLAGVIATQRLAKVAKNVAAEASNFLMGRTFLDIDMARAADLLGMERRQADAIRDLARGEFLALGPAISRRPISVRIGAVTTGAKNASPKLLPLPTGDTATLRNAMFEASAQDAPSVLPAPTTTPAGDLLRTIGTPALAAVPSMPVIKESEQEAIRGEAVAAVAAEGARLPTAQMFQDYLLRCRTRGVNASDTLAEFRRRLAMAQAGLRSDLDWDEALSLAAALPDEMWAPFLAIARAARDCDPCPDDDALAALYGTSSPGRARRMLSFIEASGLLVVRVDMLGKRSISLPHLGWTTGAGQAQQSQLDKPRRRMGARQ